MAPFRKSLSALLIGFSLSPVAWSLGFGELQLQSDLNQPLQAEIPILGVPAYANDSVRIRLGKREDFAALGYDYAPEMDDIRAELQQRDNRLVLQLRSRTALREPLLNLVLVAEEGNTRYLRDYAILLDLPDNRARSLASEVIERNVAPPITSTDSPAVIPATTPSATATTSAAPTAPAPTTTSTITSAPTERSATFTANQTVYGPTQAGESLSIIAHRLGKAAGVEWQAYGVALYHTNPNAFLGGDPNRLKAAVPLQLPNPADVARYQRRDWLALFNAPASGVADKVPVRETVAAVSSAAPTPVASPQTSDETVSAAVLSTLQQQNSELKTELAAATARMQALETQLAQLDSRYQSLTAQAASTPVVTEATVIESATPESATSESAPSESAPSESTTATPQTAATAESVSAPVVAAVPESPPAAPPVNIEVRDRVPASEVVTATAADNVVTPSQPSVWSLIMWPLAVVVALIAAGAVFWQWRERRQHNKLLQPRTKAPRVPKPVLPAAEVDEPAVPQIELGNADRRMLKIKQVQSALETYLAYQRFDRALELLEHEMHIAGDDLVLRRQLQRLQKDVRNAQTEWQESHKEQMSELFDRATTTHVDKPAARDDSKKTLG